MLTLRPIDYLIIGHVTQDQTARGAVLGGTATFAGLTAQALGMRVGIITAAAPHTDLSPLGNIQVLRIKSEATSTFQNSYGPEGRVQSLLDRAVDININSLPEEWSDVGLLHCAPIANEVDFAYSQLGSSDFIGITPQGWLRRWDSSGMITLRHWDSIRRYLIPSAVVVLSQEDLGGTLEAASEIAAVCKILAITLGEHGVMVYSEGETRHIQNPRVKALDPTGAGDIFAATFFIQLKRDDDPWSAALKACQLAAYSTTRMGLASIPNPEEVQDALQLRLS